MIQIEVMVDSIHNVSQLDGFDLACKPHRYAAPIMSGDDNTYLLTVAEKSPFEAGLLTSRNTASCRVAASGQCCIQEQNWCRFPSRSGHPGPAVRRFDSPVRIQEVYCNSSTTIGNSRHDQQLIIEIVIAACYLNTASVSFFVPGGIDSKAFSGSGDRNEPAPYAQRQMKK